MTPRRGFLQSLAAGLAATMGGLLPRSADAATVATPAPPPVAAAPPYEPGRLGGYAILTENHGEGSYSAWFAKFVWPNVYIQESAPFRCREANGSADGFDGQVVVLHAIGGEMVFHLAPRCP